MFPPLWGRTRVKFLLDTNVVISAEPTSPESAEPRTRPASVLIGLLSAGEHQHFIHPASRVELGRDREVARRELRMSLLSKYPSLPSPPAESPTLVNAIGRADAGSNDEVDHLMLSAVMADAVDYLVTDDQGIHRKSRRLGISDRVLTIADAIATVRGLFPTQPHTPPAVELAVCHALDSEDPIFDSLRTDYPGFDEWLSERKREQRKVWVVSAGANQCAGICIIKPEDGRELGLPGPTLKICSFKISDNHRGERFGELLLKAALEYAASNGYVTAYVTVFEKHQSLVAMFEMFGFEVTSQRTDLDEVVLVKRMTCTREEYASMSPLEVHTCFGPHIVKLEGVHQFVVPIQPRYHRMLFPELESQLSMLAPRAFGNSILKAYLCRASIRQIHPGDLLLFYQSEFPRTIAAIGVVERTLRSQDPYEIARCVGKRTVYRFDEIEGMCDREVLAILFRQASVLKRPLTFDELESNGVLTSAPQSIVRVQEGGARWIATQIERPR